MAKSLADLYAKLGLDSSNYDAGLDKAALKAEVDGARIEGSFETMSKSFSESASAIGSIVHAISDGTEALARGAVRAVEAAVAIGLAYKATTAAIAGYTAVTTQAAGAGDVLANSYRAVRLALSPTVFTAGTLALGILVEKTIEAAVETEKLIEAQGALAARSKESFLSISALAEAEKQLGVEAGSFKLLGIENIDAAIPRMKELAGIAEQFRGIEDPIARADLAFKLFGEDAEKILPLINRDLKSAVENAYDLSRQLDQPTRESLYRIRTAFDDFIGFFKSGWRSISLESSDLWHSIKMEAITALTSVESNFHTFFKQNAADWHDAKIGIEDYFRTLASKLPSGGGGGFEPGMGLAGPAQGGVGENIPSALELTNQAKELGTALLGAMEKPKLPAEALDTKFRHLAMTAEELAAAARKAAAELAAAFATVGVIDFEREIESLNESWNTLAARGRINADVLDAYNRKMQELSDKVPGVTQAYLNLGLQQDALAKGWKDISNGLSATGLALDKIEKQIAAARDAMKSWQDGTLATIPTALTDVTQNADLLRYSMERLGQVFANLEQIGVDSFKAIKGSILETSEIMAGMGLKSTVDLRTEATRLGDEYQRLIELQREGKASTLDVAGAYDKWTEAEEKVVGISRTLSTEQQQALRDVRQAINSISSSLADSIVHWKGFENVGITVLESIGKAILKNVIQHFLDATGLLDKLLSGLGSVLSKVGLGGLSGAAGAATAKAASGAATTAASGASQAASSASSATGSSLATGLGIASLGVDIASGIATGIQLAHIESDVAKIEISTRQCKEQLTGGIQTALNTYLPELKHLTDIWGALVNGPLQDIDDVLRYGAIHVTTDMSDIGGFAPDPGAKTKAENAARNAETGATPAIPVVAESLTGMSADVKSIRTQFDRSLANPDHPIDYQGYARQAAANLHAAGLLPNEVHASTFDERVAALIASIKATEASGGNVQGIGARTYNPVADIASTFGVSLKQAMAIFDADAAKQPAAWRAAIDPNIRKFNEGLITSEELLKLQAEAIQHDTDILQDPAHQQAAAQAAALAEAQSGLIPATTAYQQAQRDLATSTRQLQQQVDALQHSFWSGNQSPESSAATTAQINALGSHVAAQGGITATEGIRGANTAGGIGEGFAGQTAINLTDFSASRAQQEQIARFLENSRSSMAAAGEGYKEYLKSGSKFSAPNSKYTKEWEAFAAQFAKTEEEAAKMRETLWAQYQAGEIDSFDLSAGLNNVIRSGSAWRNMMKPLGAGVVAPSGVATPIDTSRYVTGAGWGPGGPGNLMGGNAFPSHIPVTVAAADETSRGTASRLVTALRELGVNIT